MGEEVEEPVAHDEGRERQRRGCTSAAHEEVEAGQSGTPDEQGDQAVRVGVAHEMQRRHDRVARSDVDRLETEKQEGGPQQVGELRREEEGAERDRRDHPLGAEAEGEVADEHGVGLRKLGGGEV